jgi:act minimal PKS acyl carrier protein
MADPFGMTQLTEILRTSIGLDADVRFDGELAETEFTELGYDSLAMIELASQVQRRYGVQITDEAVLDQMRSPREAVDFVNSLLAGKVA